MLIALIVMAAVFGVLLLTTVVLSKDWVAAGIRGTVRYGVFGTTIFLPIVAAVALFVLCVYGFVASVLYMLDLVK